MTTHTEKDNELGPNDLKLSECGAGQDACVAGPPGAGSMTSVAVRCCAQLGDVTVDDIDQELEALSRKEKIESLFSWGMPLFGPKQGQTFSLADRLAEIAQDRGRLLQLRQLAAYAGRLSRPAPQH